MVVLDSWGSEAQFEAPDLVSVWLSIAELEAFRLALSAYQLSLRCVEHMRKSALSDSPSTVRPVLSLDQIVEL